MNVYKKMSYRHRKKDPAIEFCTTENPMTHVFSLIEGSCIFGVRKGTQGTHIGVMGTHIIK